MVSFEFRQANDGAFEITRIAPSGSAPQDGAKK
jgi:hypothetical protein